MSVSDAMLSLLGDIFSNTEAGYKISVTADASSMSISVEYEDIDEEWFKEVQSLLDEQREKSG